MKSNYAYQIREPSNGVYNQRFRQKTCLPLSSNSSRGAEFHNWFMAEKDGKVIRIIMIEYTGFRCHVKPYLPTNDVLIIWIANDSVKLCRKIRLQPRLFLVTVRGWPVTFLIWWHLHLWIISISVVDYRLLHLRLLPLTRSFIFIIVHVMRCWHLASPIQTL